MPFTSSSILVILKEHSIILSDSPAYISSCLKIIILNIYQLELFILLNKSVDFIEVPFLVFNWSDIFFTDNCLFLSSSAFLNSFGITLPYPISI